MHCIGPPLDVRLWTDVCACGHCACVYVCVCVFVCDLALSLGLGFNFNVFASTSTSNSQDGLAKLRPNLSFKVNDVVLCLLVSVLVLACSQLKF